MVLTPEPAKSPGIGKDDPDATPLRRSPRKPTPTRRYGLEHTVDKPLARKRSTRKLSSRKPYSAPSRKPLSGSSVIVASASAKQSKSSTSKKPSSAPRKLTASMKRAPTSTPSKNKAKEPEALSGELSAVALPWDFSRFSRGPDRRSQTGSLTQGPDHLASPSREASVADSWTYPGGRTRQEDADYWMSQGRSPVFPHMDYPTKRSPTPALRDYLGSSVFPTKRSATPAPLRPEQWWNDSMVECLNSVGLQAEHEFLVGGLDTLRRIRSVTERDAAEPDTRILLLADSENPLDS